MNPIKAFFFWRAVRERLVYTRRILKLHRAEKAVEHRFRGRSARQAFKHKWKPWRLVTARLRAIEPELFDEKPRHKWW